MITASSLLYLIFLAWCSYSMLFTSNMLQSIVQSVGWQYWFGKAFVFFLEDLVWHQRVISANLCLFHFCLCEVRINRLFLITFIAVITVLQEKLCLLNFHPLTDSFFTTFFMLIHYIFRTFNETFIFLMKEHFTVALIFLTTFKLC